MKTLKIFKAFLSINFQNNLALKSSFIFQIVLMIANNLIYLAIWFILFDHIKAVNAWTIQDIATLNMISCASWGIFQIFSGGFRVLSRTIIYGDLDSFLLYPFHPLIMIMFSKSYPSGWGNLLTAFIMLPFCGNFSFLLLMVIIICSFSIFGSAFVLIHSLAFWKGNIESFAKQWTDFIYILSIYPQNVYPGFIKIILFTLLPAGFISFLPVEILRKFSWGKVAFLILGSILFIGMSLFIFKAGLKRYESGNRIGRST